MYCALSREYATSEERSSIVCDRKSRDDSVRKHNVFVHDSPAIETWINLCFVDFLFLDILCGRHTTGILTPWLADRVTEAG